jgi:hypothetical protein
MIGAPAALFTNCIEVQAVERCPRTTLLIYCDEPAIIGGAVDEVSIPRRTV